MNKENLRPVEFIESATKETKKGFFHGFYNDAADGDSYPMAIIELNNGRIVTNWDIKSIKFLDREN